MRDEDIDYSDIPAVTPEQFAKAVARRGLETPKPKKQIMLRLDADVLAWFRSQDRGYQTQINSLLRAFMEEHRHRR